jgi:hypothetical protein
MMTRNETIAQIKAALKARTGKSWSVTGGSGTAWGWLKIDVPPKARIYTWEGKLAQEGEYGHVMSAEARAELAQVLGLESVHAQGVSIPSGGGYYEEYIARAQGKTPTVYGERYWD